jgi:hypothetical protein
VQVLDLLDVGRRQLRDVLDTERGRYDRGRRARDAVTELEIVRRIRAHEAGVHFRLHGVAHLFPRHPAAVKRKHIVRVSDEVAQSHRQLVVILKCMDERRRINVVLAHELEYQAQEFRVACQQRMLVARAGDEVIRQVRAPALGLAHILEREGELLERKSSELAHHVANELVRGVGQRMAFRPDAPGMRIALDSQQAVGIEPHHSIPEHTQLMDGITDHEPLRGEARIEPVQRGLALLEVMQIDPAAVHAIYAADDVRGAPIRILDAGLVKDPRGEHADDIAFGLQGIDNRRAQIDGVVPRGNGRQQFPVGGVDAHHVVNTGIVTICTFGKAEVRPFAGVSRDHIADDDGSMCSRSLDEALVLLLGAEIRIDIKADTVEVAVDGRCVGQTVDPAGALHGTGVNALDPDRLECAPQPLVCKS